MQNSWAQKERPTHFCESALSLLFLYSYRGRNKRRALCILVVVAKLSNEAIAKRVVPYPNCATWHSQFVANFSERHFFIPGVQNEPILFADGFANGLDQFVSEEFSFWRALF